MRHVLFLVHNTGVQCEALSLLVAAALAVPNRLIGPQGHELLECRSASLLAQRNGVRHISPFVVNTENIGYEAPSTARAWALKNSHDASRRHEHSHSANGMAVLHAVPHQHHWHRKIHYPANHVDDLDHKQHIAMVDTGTVLVPRQVLVHYSQLLTGSNMLSLHRTWRRVVASEHTCHDVLLHVAALQAQGANGNP